MLSLIRRWDGALLMAATIAAVGGCGGDDTTPANNVDAGDAGGVTDARAPTDARPGTDGAPSADSGGAGQDGAVTTDGAVAGDGSVTMDGGIADASLDGAIADGGVGTDGAPATDSGIADVSLDGAVADSGGPDGAALDSGGPDGATTDGAVGSDGAASADAHADADASVLLTDADIMEILITADNGEISEAQYAISHASLPTVVTFAQTIQTDHLAHRQMLTDLVSTLDLVPTPNAFSDSLATTAAQDLIDLQLQMGAQLDATYVRDQVAVHTQILSLIDEQLLPAAQNASIRSTLESTRTVIAAHLAAGQLLLSSLMDGGVAQNAGDAGDAGDAGEDAGP